MFENPRRGRQVRNFTTNAPKILGLKSSSEQIFSRKLPLGAPDCVCQLYVILGNIFFQLKNNVKKKDSEQNRAFFYQYLTEAFFFIFFTA